MAGLSSIYSTIDSIKRVLGDALSNPRQFIQSAGASAQASPLTVDQAAAFGPGATGKILFHGGPQAITKINTELGQSLAKGPGFYLSNILNTPLNFATNGGKRSGVISAFDIPDADYARMLRLNTKPLTDNYPELSERVAMLLRDNPQLRSVTKESLRENGSGSRLHGEWLNQIMETLYGVSKTPAELGKVGIPGKIWQYSAERPAEMASVVFPDYSNLLEPVAQLSVEPGIAGARAANIAMKAILGIK